MNPFFILCTAALCGCATEYFTLPNGGDVEILSELQLDVASLEEPGLPQIDPEEEVPDHRLTQPEEGATYSLDEFVPVVMTVDAPPDRYLVYYAINQRGGWFGPPNEVFAIQLAPYAVDDGYVFAIEAELLDTKDSEIVGYDVVVVYGE